jgi:hypothetical protein
MGTSVLVAAVAAISMGTTLPQSVKSKQDETFEKYWGAPFVWKYDEMPKEGSVPEFRIPYSGYIYPDTGGGTARSMRKYDAAFNGGRGLASGYERYDTTAYKKPERRGLFGLRTRMETPAWHGHCNGWTAAAIRHAEPQRSVKANGVVFSPAEIKGLLAEIYIYNDTLDLAGFDYSMNPAALHAILCNWIGLNKHPIGVEADPGEEKWNYPIYAYSSTATRYRNGVIDVRMNVKMGKDSNGEFDESPRIEQTKYFHYALYVNSRGEVTGGQFYRDSSRIDLLWVPLQPKQGKQPGNERGNPHVDVNKVLAVWRASVPQEERMKWPVVDPPAADKILDATAVSSRLPVQDPHWKPAAENVASTDNATSTEETAETSTPATEATAGTTEATAAPATTETDEGSTTETAASEETQPESTEETAAVEESVPATETTTDANESSPAEEVDEEVDATASADEDAPVLAPPATEESDEPVERTAAAVD